MARLEQRLQAEIARLEQSLQTVAAKDGTGFGSATQGTAGYR